MLSAFRIEFPPELPISARAGEIVDAIQAHPVIILAGETGSGKTTQIPKMCLAAGRGTKGRIACTQPRRVAALSVSRRVAEELGVSWGREVGCKIRFQDQTTTDTLVKFLTDGMLLAEVQGDPMLRAYDTIIIDEAHERSLNIDFLLGHLRLLRHRRPELRIIVTSATIDTAAFSAAFDDAPVIQVEGRTFPVEVVYAPLDSLGMDLNEPADADEAPAYASAKAEAVHYIDGAVESVRRILRESGSGDILVFMPSERDIRETVDLIEGGIARKGSDGKRGPGAELVPLFGRLSAAEQQRVFAPSQRRKIVVATNVAETSLTIPGIRFVVDTGLARISRYAPQSRTRRLPIEAISQSSADQRKGRAGRLANGVCIRLYSEKDYHERPRFTQPEIQRANLADVILRMKAFGLGDIERFPFINMPSAKSIRAGYALLEELGAIGPEDRGRKPEDSPDQSIPSSALRPLASELTAIGRELARLPVDPTVGRMILQSFEEKATREVLVIAAGLSIQDPRERPLDKQAQADAAHKRFAHPDSDFLTLLNIWESAHGEFETMSQSKLRRFCRDHFLSYVRMREWRDIHDSVRDGIASGLAREDGRGRGHTAKPGRVSSVLDGGIAHAAPSEEPGAGRRRKGQTADPLSFGQPGYRAIHRSILTGLLGNIAQRQEDGSYKAAHDRKVSLFPGSTLFQPAPRNSSRSDHKPAAKPRAAWIMAAEIVETARHYARTCARLDPAWVLDLAGHIVRVAHSEPFWDETKGRVLVRQRTRLYGLEIDSRAVGYGRIDPRHATEIFIREGLVNDTIVWPFDFLAHNRRVREQVGDVLARTRDSGYLDIDEAAYRFYAARLMPEKEQGAGSKGQEKALSKGGVSAVAELVDVVRERRGAEPGFLKMLPADLHDPAALARDTEAFPAGVPIDNRVLPLAYSYKPGQEDDGVTLEIGLREAEGLTQAALDWAVPGHLETKVEFLLRAMPKDLRRAFMPLAETARSVAVQVTQRDRLTGRRETLPEAVAAVLRERARIAIDPAAWTDKPLPDHLRVRVRVLDEKGCEVCASRELGEIRRHAGERLAPAKAGSVETQRAALSRKIEEALGRELGWLERDLRDLRQLGPLTATLAPLANLQADAADNIRRWVVDPSRLGDPPDAANLAAAAERARADLRGLVPRLVDLLKEVLTQRQNLMVHEDPFPGLKHDLDGLVPPDFLRRIPFAQLRHVPRYLKAMQVRADQWRKNPARDAKRAAQITPYVHLLRNIEKSTASASAETLRWLIEEYRVSLFAQELGTSEPVSAAKLDRLISGAENDPPEPKPAGTSGAIRPMTAETDSKPKPLKNLAALDRLFRKP